MKTLWKVEIQKIKERLDIRDRIFFNDVDITRFIDVRKVSTSLAAPVNTSFKTYNRTSGGILDHVSQGMIQISIKFSIRKDTLGVIDELNRILHTKEEKVLYFEDQPDRYLMAIYSGNSEMNRRYYGSTSTLTFISSRPYWFSKTGEREFPLDSEGRFLVVNNGTTSTVPFMEFKFPTENGFLGIVSPNGFLYLGDKEERDKISLPKQELLMNEEMHLGAMNDTETDWHALTDTYNMNITLADGSIENIKGPWIPDYDKLSIGTGTKKHTEYGMSIAKSTAPKVGYYWNTYGYYRRMDRGVDESQYSIKTNWKLESRVTFFNASGKKNDTGMFLIVVMDVHNRPILTTSIYNILDNSNEVTISAKTNANNGASQSSKIVKTAKFPNGFDGNIKMETSTNGYVSWSFDSNRDQKVSTLAPTTEKFSIGNTAYIRNDAKYGYGYDGVQHSVKDFTRGRPYNIQATRIWSGKKQYLISYQGVQVYWMNEGDMTANKSGVGKTVVQQTSDAKKNVTHSMYAPQLTKMQAHKVVVLGGTWDNTSPFSNSSINSVKMFKLNGENAWIEINNTFQPNDVLTIDNKNGEILLNGSPYDGYFDYDSRFFDIDWGTSEIQVLKSSWSAMPQGIMRIEERFK